MSFGFSKSERLTGKYDTDLLLKEGFSFFVFPLRITFRTHPKREGEVTRVLVMVSKRKIRTAVERNTVKRRIREAYRLNKHELASFLHIGLDIGILFSHTKAVPFKNVEKALILALRRISSNLEKQRHGHEQKD